MNYWKLGCRWGSKSKGLPLFFEMLLKHNIVISWSDKDFGSNSKVILTDGHTVIGVAKTLSNGTSIKYLDHLKKEFENYKIDCDENLLVYNAEIFQINESDTFDYKLVQGICAVLDQEAIRNTDRLYNKYFKLMEFGKIKDLLFYKKQIILQGPPGTGKTRLARKITDELILENKIDEFFFRDNLKAPVEFKPVDFDKNYKSLYITSIIDNTINFKGTSTVPEFSFTFKELLEFYKSEQWKSSDFLEYKNYAKKATIKYLFRLEKNKVLEKQFKIIQFHPSYTYEDFVRGIIAETKGERIEYKNVNKTIGLFAQKALKNFFDSKKEVSTISKEKWLDDNFNLFVEKIAEDLNNDKFFKLTENVNIVDLEDNAFLYIGNAWKGYEHRMLFKDIKQAFLDGNSIRKDLSNNLNISGSARQHATYYVLVLKAFLDFVKDKPFKKNDEDEVREKSFVLIIDEINRANLSSVLGELIYALEYRGEEVESMYEVDGSQKLILPPNLYIIGTMNTADRSVGHIDYAIRRRFAFVDVPPQELQDDDEIYFNTSGFNKISALFNNTNVSKEFEKDAVKIGHSYFIIKKEDAKDEAKRDELFNLKMQYEVKPILLEYERDGILIGEYQEKSIKEYIKSL